MLFTIIAQTKKLKRNHTLVQRKNYTLKK